MKEKLASITDTEAVVFENWVSSRDVVAMSKKESWIIQDCGWEENTVVFQFFGNLGRLQGLKLLADAIPLVKRPEARFLFIGAGAEANMIKDALIESEDGKVKFFDAIPMESKSIGLASCDVAVVSLNSGAVGCGVPSKAYFSLAANRPILSLMSEHAQISRTVSRLGVGWVVSDESPISVALAIDKICDEIIEGRTFNARQKFEAHLDATTSVPRLVQEVCNL